jgi:hypothetical protein
MLREARNRSMTTNSRILRVVVVSEYMIFLLLDLSMKVDKLRKGDKL